MTNRANSDSGNSQDVDVENLPDRESAERNSVYKLAEEAAQKYPSADDRAKGVKDKAPDRKSAERNSVYKLAEEAGQKYGSGSNQNDKGVENFGDNNIPETVSLDTKPYDGPSKLDGTSGKEWDKDSANTYKFSAESGSARSGVIKPATKSN